MTEGTQGAERNATSKQTQEERAHTEAETYTYKDSGIRERHGRVPIWLQLVTYGLLIWGIYYTIRYW